MSMQIPADVAAQIAVHLQSGMYETSEDVLREALKALDERQNDFEAIRAGIADMEAGRVRPLSEVDAEIREKHGFAK